MESELLNLPPGLILLEECEKNSFQVSDAAGCVLCHHFSLGGTIAIDGGQAMIGIEASSNLHGNARRYDHNNLMEPIRPIDALQRGLNGRRGDIW